MLTNFQMSCNLQECRQNWCALALCAVLSAGLGALFADASGDTYVLLMRMAASRPVSIVGSAVSVFLPFLVSVFFITHSKPWLVYLICGTRIFLFSSAAFAIGRSFGSAGWLVRLMLQMPDLCLIPVLMWFSGLTLAGNCTKRVITCCVLLAAVIGMLDYCVISPFLANLIDSYETMGRYAIHVGLDRCL